MNWVSGEVAVVVDPEILLLLQKIAPDRLKPWFSSKHRIETCAESL
jgi:hypothetical protein